MSKTLVVKAHPLTGKDSFTVHILDKFLETYSKVNPDEEIEVLDLFSENIPEVDGDILTGWNELKAGKEFSALTPAQAEKIARYNELTEQFLATDKIIIANALWNLNVPTRLKAWIDTIMVAGKTFSYSETGPVALLSGKKALHIQSSGGNYNGNDFSAQYVKSIMGFVGINDFSQIFIEGIDYNPNLKDEILGAAEAKAEELAKTF